MNIGQLHDRLTSLIADHGRDLKVELVVEVMEGQFYGKLTDVALPRKYLNGAETPEPATHIVLLHEE